MVLCFASNNAHKLQEVGAILGADFSLRTLRDIGCLDELPETTDTIPGNARQKASYVWDRYHVPCFADDSGLEVDALNGAPGVHSAYYAGPERSAEANIQRVLGALTQGMVRSARFRTVIHLITEEGHFSFEGILNGMILTSPRGTNGFGYDPIFQPEGWQRSLAEAAAEEKNRISHRAIAIRKLARHLQSTRRENS